MLNSRLKKLEASVGVADLCSCFGQRAEVYFSTENEDGTFSEPKQNGEPVPDICGNCRKAIDKQRIDVQFVRSWRPIPEEAKFQIGRD